MSTRHKRYVCRVGRVASEQAMTVKNVCKTEKKTKKKCGRRKDLTGSLPPTGASHVPLFSPHPLVKFVTAADVAAQGVLV
jgi:hypothetical protein